MVPVDPELVQRAVQAVAVGGDQGSGRARPPQRLPDRQAQPAAAVHGSVRRAGHAGELPAARIEHARAAGAGAAERRPSRISEAEALAERLETEAGPDPRKQVDRAYRLAAGRAPNPKEMQQSRGVSEDATAAGVRPGACSTSTRFCT